MRTAKQPVRAAIYTRISLDKSGERLGVQRQLDDCAALADRLGWSVIERFDDNDLSAYSGRTRPGFEALLDSLKRGEIDALICWHPDRLYRSLKDLVRLLDVAEAVEIRTVNGGDLDLSTATGKMLATILGSVSFQESAHKAERQRSAAAQRAANGKPQWKRAFGYVAGENGPEIDPEIQPLVEQAYAAVLAGSSLSDICRLWNDAGALTQRWVRPKDSRGTRSRARSRCWSAVRGPPRRCQTSCANRATQGCAITRARSSGRVSGPRSSTRTSGTRCRACSTRQGEHQAARRSANTCSPEC